MGSQNFYEINILDMLNALLRRWWILFLSMVIGIVTIGAYPYLFMTPMYQSNILMYVNNSAGTLAGATSISISTSQISAAKTLVDTYCVILDSRLTLNDLSAKIKNDYNYDYSYEELHSMISGGRENDTEVFRITVHADNPDKACNIANAITTILPEKVASIVNGSSMKIVDMAVPATGSYSPVYSRYAVIGAVLGLFISAAVIVILQYFNDSVHTSDWLSDAFEDGYLLLAVVPRVGHHSGRSGYGSYGKYYGNNKYYGYYGYGEKKKSGSSSTKSSK